MSFRHSLIGISLWKYVTQIAQRLITILFAATCSLPDQSITKKFFATAVTYEFSKSYAFNFCSKCRTLLRSLSAHYNFFPFFFHLFGRLVKVMGVSNVCVCLLFRAFNTCCLADYCRAYTKKLDLSPVESDTCRIGRVAPVGDSHSGRYTGPAVLPHYPTSSAMILVYIYRWIKEVLSAYSW